MQILEALGLAQSGHKVRPECWDDTHSSCHNPGHWVEFRGGHFVEHGHMEEIPHALRLSRPEEFLGEWLVVEVS